MVSRLVMSRSVCRHGVKMNMNMVNVLDQTWTDHPDRMVTLMMVILIITLIIIIVIVIVMNRVRQLIIERIRMIVSF